MSTEQRYDVVCIGNYTKDTIIKPEGVTYVDGGAVNYAAHAAVRLGLNVAVVTRLAKEDQRVIDKFTAAGIDCYPTFTPSSTLMQLEYPTSNPDIRTLTVTDTAGTITPEDISGLNGMKSAVIGTSFRGEVGIDVIKALSEKDVVLAADAQGFVRVLVDQELKKEDWPDMEETLAFLDVLKADAVEAECLTGEADMLKPRRHLPGSGPKEIVLTHKDGLLIYVDGEFFPNKFYPKQLNGRSGRGDTCLGAYMAMRISKPPKEAGIWAAALASLKMEQEGPFNRTFGEIEELIHSKYNGSSPG